MRTDHERIGGALDLLTQGVFPFFEREMKRVYAEEWMEAAAASFRHDRSPSGTGGDAIRWDAHTLLTVIWDQWNAVFRSRLGPAERSLVGELRDFRNRWANQVSLDADDAYRVLDSVERLLVAVGGDGVRDVEQEKLDVLREMFSDEFDAELALQQFKRSRRRNVAVFLVCGLTIVATTAVFLGPQNPLAAGVLSLFVAFVFGFFITQRMVVEKPTCGVHECNKCRKVVYTEVCPYCESSPKSLVAHAR